MFSAIEKNAELQKKYMGIMREHQKVAEDMIAGQLIEFGKAAGFSFSKDDLIAARSELTDKLNSNRELSDNDLANVAGGNAFYKTFVAVSSVTFIVGCAAVSLIAENKEKDMCGKALSITVSDCPKVV